jgi:DNA-binding FadR family transcriptional regulator
VPRAANDRGRGQAKLAEVVARQIEEDIVARGWPVGTVLGSETELVDRYGVSRAVLREAVRIVEHHFVATMRRGPGGGLVITAPNVEGIVRAVTLQLEYEQIEPHHIHEARTMLELTCVRLAAERLTAADTAMLREQMEFDRTAPGRPQNFHVWIAQLTGNPALALFVAVLSMLMRDYLDLPESSAPVVAELNRSHREITEALIARDGPEAERLLLAHLEHVKGWIRPTVHSSPGRARRGA